MRSPAAALIWDYMWLRNRTLIGFAIGIVALGSLLNLLWPNLARNAGGLVNFFLAVSEALVLLAIFSYTEQNPHRGTNGFPHRLFVLPVTTFRLVAIPMFLSVAIVETIILADLNLSKQTLENMALHPAEDRTIWIAIQAGVFIVLYQTVLWTLPGLKALRVLIIGLLGVFMIMLRIFPFVRRLPDATVMSALVIVSIFAFVVSWISVALRRSGATLVSDSLMRHIVPRIAARIPQRNPARATFDSPQSAQFWFEWRRSGSVLPVLVGSILIFVITPISWAVRDNGPDSLRILVTVFVLPILLALAVGKAFSKPDYWSKELSLPGFISVRPLSSADIVAAKLKVAALSTVVAWSINLGFLLLLPRWANLDSLTMIRATLWSIHGHRIFPQYAIAVLVLFTGVLLTWRFLVDGLWLGLSGNTKVFALSALPYVIVPLLVVPTLMIQRQPILSWIQQDLRRGLPVIVWTTAAAVVAKFWLAAFSWGKGAPRTVRRYLPVWLACTLWLAALAFLLADALGSIVPVDAYRLRTLLILISMQVMPLGRLGLAPGFLERNRHR